MFKVMVYSDRGWFEHGISTEAGWLCETDNIETAKLMLLDALQNHLLGDVMLVKVIPFTIQREVVVDV